MAGFYDTNRKFDLNLVKSAAGGTGAALKNISKVAMDIGNVKQQSVTRAKKDAQLKLDNKRADDTLELHKAKFDLNKKTQENKAKQLAIEKTAKIVGFRKLHPKTTKDLTDEEVYQLGDTLNKLHTDATKRKVIDVYTAEDGNKIAVTWDGSYNDDKKPNFVNTVLGKSKDWGNSSSKDGTGFVSKDGKKFKSGKELSDSLLNQAKNKRDARTFGKMKLD